MSNRIMGKEYLQEQLHQAYKNYCSAKGIHSALRASAMHKLAQARAVENNTDKLKKATNTNASKSTKKNCKEDKLPQRESYSWKHIHHFSA